MTAQPNHNYLLGRTHFNAEGAQFAWDSTSLKAAYECPRKYFYTMMHDWAGGGSVHLIFGGHYARALETYHKLRIVQELDHDDATRQVVHQTLVESWMHNLDKEGQPIPGTGHPQIFEAVGNAAGKTRENLIRSIIWYLETYREHDFATYVQANGEPAVELSFKLEVENGLVLCGHLDRVIEYDSSSKFIQDQKSTGAVLNKRYFNQFDLDIQMSTYTLVGKTIFNLPVKGVMIDAAQVAVGFTEFMRDFTYRSEAQLDEFYHFLLKKVATIQLASRRYAQTLDPDEFEPNWTACGNYGGCPFRTVCNTAKHNRPKFMRANFKKREMWNPLVER